MTEINKKQLKIKKGISVKYTVTYQDISGEQHTSGMFDTIEEAENYLNNFDCSIATKITYGEIFGNFLARAKLKYASSTYNNYLQYYNRFFKKYDSIEYNKITSITWQNYLMK